MKLTPSSVARRRTASAPSCSLWRPQIPSPVRRMAPKPRRLTVSSPPSETVPLEPASGVLGLLFMFILQSIRGEMPAREPYESLQTALALCVVNPRAGLLALRLVGVGRYADNEGFRRSRLPGICASHLLA